MSTFRPGHQIIRKVAQCPLVCPDVPHRYTSCASAFRIKKKWTKSKSVDNLPREITISRLPPDKHGNRCGYYFSLHEPRQSWIARSLARLLGRDPKPSPLPTNCPPTDKKKEQVYWFGFEKDEIDERCDPSKPPKHKCRKHQKLMAEQCGCLPKALLCDSMRFHCPGIIRETYSAEPLIYRRSEPKPRHPPKPPLPPAVRCIQLASSFLPVSDDSVSEAGSPKPGYGPTDASEVNYEPYDEFNYVKRQRRAKRNAEFHNAQLLGYC